MKVWVSVLLNSGLIYFLALWMFRVQRKSRAPVLHLQDFTIRLENFPKDNLDEGLLKEFFEEVLGCEVRRKDISVRKS